jgi:glucosamine--fructose-6-phosphate aminotransferase (isomerizing)
MYVGSDPLAVSPFTERVTYLEDGDYVAVDHATVRIFDAAGEAVERPMKRVDGSPALMEKGNHRHFMEKEIHEQPYACQQTLSAYVDPTTGGRPRRGSTSPRSPACRSWPAGPPTSPG